MGFLSSFFGISDANSLVEHNKLIALTKKQARENSVFINIMNDLALSPFGQEQGVKFSKDDEVFIMAYAYARRFAACALYLRGILKRDIVAYTQDIWYNYGMQTSGEVEFQEKASDYANEFLQTYSKKFTKEFVITLSSFVIPKINNNEKLGIGKFVDGDDWLIDFIETKINKNPKFRNFISAVNNDTQLSDILNKLKGAISNTFNDWDDAYEFVCEQLDAASFGNAISKNFVLDSKVPYDDYANGMNRFSEKGGEILINTIGQMSMPQEVMALMQLYIVDRIMEEYNIGKYNDEISF